MVFSLLKHGYSTVFDIKMTGKRHPTDLNYICVKPTPRFRLAKERESFAAAQGVPTRLRAGTPKRLDAPIPPDTADHRPLAAADRGLGARHRRSRAIRGAPAHSCGAQVPARLGVARRGIDAVGVSDSRSERDRGEDRAFARTGLGRGAAPDRNHRSLDRRGRKALRAFQPVGRYV